MGLTSVKIKKDTRKEEILSLLKPGVNTNLKISVAKALDKLNLEDLNALYVFAATLDESIPDPIEDSPEAKPGEYRIVPHITKEGPFRCVTPGTDKNGGVWDQLDNGNWKRVSDYTLCCYLDKFGTTVIVCEHCGKEKGHVIGCANDNHFD